MNRAAATAVTIQRLDRAHAPQTIALLDLLRVSLFGVRSRRLYDALVADGIAQRIDCRIALASGDVCGVVLAAPRAYWTSTLLTHWTVAYDCVHARLFTREAPSPHAFPSAAVNGGGAVAYDDGPPPRTWANPGRAWRIIVVGTAPAARGRGVAAELYRAMMRDRPLVARIAVDNHASIRLHRSVGWRLYPDGDVVLAVYNEDSRPGPRD